MYNMIFGITFKAMDRFVENDLENNLDILNSNSSLVSREAQYLERLKLSE